MYPSLLCNTHGVIAIINTRELINVSVYLFYYFVLFESNILQPNKKTHKTKNGNVKRRMKLYIQILV